MATSQPAPSGGRLAGKVAIVTGGGSGFGAAMAMLFAAEGARVVVADLSGAQEAVASGIGPAALPVHVDVSLADDVRRMVDTTVTAFGRLDILCNNAGIAGPVGPTADCEDAVFDRVLAVNLRGVFLGMKHAIPHMLANGGGAIVNTSSIAAKVAFPGLPAYAASKGGVSMLTQVTAAEYAAQGIRVNAILPGVFETGMTRDLPTAYIQGALKQTPMKRIGEAGEVARLALFLASDEAQFMTGALIPVDGGYTLI